jgi:D-methionine transport system substrate-binding protein
MLTTSGNEMNRSFFLGTLLVCATLSPLCSASARTVVRVGVTDGPQAEIMRQVKKIAAGRDLDLEIVPYSDSGAISGALAEGGLDAASFQDGVALDTELKARGYRFSPAALTVTLPMGLYSRKIRSLAALVPGAEVAIPLNPHDAARALVLLHNYGLIRIRDGAGLGARLRDVVKNPRRLRFVELPPGRLAERLGTASLAAIPYPEAAKAGLQPARDGIGMEDGRSPWAGVLTVRSADLQKPWVGRLVSAYRSDEIKRFILHRYRDSVRRPW